MAANKNSFILYADLVHSIEILTNEQAGKLFKHILNYVNDFDPNEEDVVVRVAFEPIKQRLKKDLKKWRTERKKRSDAGRKGGLKTQAKFKQNQAVLEGAKANQAVSGNGSVSVSVNNTLPPSDGFYNAEDFILNNQIQFERILVAAKNINLEEAKNALRKFHLHLEENSRYPQSKKQLLAGFEKWLLKEKKFIHNGTHQQTSGSSKPGTAERQNDAATKW